MQGGVSDLIFLISTFSRCVSLHIIAHHHNSSLSESINDNIPKMLYCSSQWRKGKHYHWSRMRRIVTGTRRFVEIIFLKLLLPITSCLSLSDPHISVFARPLSVLYYLALQGSFIHMHALFEVIRYDTPESPVLRCVCPAVICVKIKINENL